MNTGELSWPDPDRAAWRVRQMQRKLHHWAVDDSDRCFDDRVQPRPPPGLSHRRVGTGAGQQGRTLGRCRPAGTCVHHRRRRDGGIPGPSTSRAEGLGHLLHFRCGRRLIPKPGSSKLRRLGIPTAMDRTVQASLLLVLEPIFEADFKPVSYGFRPQTSRSGRDRRDSCSRVPELSLGLRG